MIILQEYFGKKVIFSKITITIWNPEKIMTTNACSGGCYRSSRCKELVIFDFDETIIDCNTDTYINSLAPQGNLPKELFHSNIPWNDFMQQVFIYLHKNGCKEEDYRKCLSQAKLVPGMEELFKNLSKGTAKKQFEIIIISDANSFSIKTILDQHNLTGYIKSIFTNPAHFDKDGCLRLGYYHNQDWCTLSPKNLCKGNVMEEYVSNQRQQNNRYDRISYVGDGANDLCPSLRLAKNDLVFARNGYPLHHLALEKMKKDELKAKIIPFETGEDIWREISQ